MVEVGCIVCHREGGDRLRGLLGIGKNVGADVRHGEGGGEAALHLGAQPVVVAPVEACLGVSRGI